MKKIFLYPAVFFCLVLSCYKLFFYFDHKSEQKSIAQNKNVQRLTPQELSLIREGDFILRRGFGFFSDYIAENLNPGSIDVTHAGIIVMKHGMPHVIHSLSSDVSLTDGMQIQPLDDFLSNSVPGKIIVTRPGGACAESGCKIAQLAESYLDRHIPFDHKGSYDDDKEFFCTELIWKILEKDLKYVSLPTEPEARRAFFHSMEPLYNTAYFSFVINQYEK